MSQEVISRNAIFAASINGLISYQTGTEKEFWRGLTADRLAILMPTKADSLEEKSTALFIQVIASMTDNIDLEAQALNLLDGADKEKAIEIAKMGFANIDEEKLLHEITPFLSALMLAAGVRNIGAAFKELDGIAHGYGLANSSEIEMKKIVEGSR